MVGIALLTLVPGEMGGSEWSTRGLLQALARGGTLQYRVYLPPVAPDAHEGLPYEIVEKYRAARTMPQRLLALGAANVRPGPLRLRLRSADVVPCPLPTLVPTVGRPGVVTLHDLEHVDLPQFFSRPTRAFRRVAYHRSVRAAQRVTCPSAFVADRAVAVLGLERSRLRV